MENTKNDFVEHVLDLLREFGPVTAKPMFGGWGLYHEGLFFALIAEDMLYFKVDEVNRAEFDAAHLEPFVYVTKTDDRMVLSYHQAPAEALDDRLVMAQWARSGYGAALRAKTRKPVRKRRPVEG